VPPRGGDRIGSAPGALPVSPSTIRARRCQKAGNGSGFFEWLGRRRVIRRVDRNQPTGTGAFRPRQSRPLYKGNSSNHFQSRTRKLFCAPAAGGHCLPVSDSLCRLCDDHGAKYDNQSGFRDLDMHTSVAAGILDVYAHGRGGRHQKVWHGIKTHTTIYFPEIHAFHIALPPVEEQKQIAGGIKKALAHVDRLEAEAARPAAIRPPRQGRTTALAGCFELDSARVRHPPGSVEDFQRDQVPLLIVVEDHARLVLIALGNFDSGPENDAQRVGGGS
jgi:hypothetical protein